MEIRRVKKPLVLIAMSYLLCLQVSASVEPSSSMTEKGNANPKDWASFNPAKFKQAKKLVPAANIVVPGAAVFDNPPFFPNDPTFANVIFGRGQKDFPTAIYSKAFDVLNIGGKLFKTPRAGQVKRIVVDKQSIAVYGTTWYTPLPDNRFVANPVRVAPFDPTRVFYNEKDLWPRVIYGPAGQKVKIANQEVEFPGPGESLEVVFTADGRCKNVPNVAAPGSSTSPEKNSTAASNSRAGGPTSKPVEGPSQSPEKTTLEKSAASSEVKVPEKTEAVPVVAEKATEVKVPEKTGVTPVVSSSVGTVGSGVAIPSDSVTNANTGTAGTTTNRSVTATEYTMRENYLSLLAGSQRSQLSNASNQNTDSASATVADTTQINWSRYIDDPVLLANNNKFETGIQHDEYLPPVDNTSDIPSSPKQIAAIPPLKVDIGLNGIELNGAKHLYHGASCPHGTEGKAIGKAQIRYIYLGPDPISRMEISDVIQPSDFSMIQGVLWATPWKLSQDGFSVDSGSKRYMKIITFDLYKAVKFTNGQNIVCNEEYGHQVPITLMPTIIGVEDKTSSGTPSASQGY